MVVQMTVLMTAFGNFASGEGVSGFFRYFPYNFTLALPIQMLVAAPLSLRLARVGAKASRRLVRFQWA